MFSTVILGQAFVRCFDECLNACIISKDSMHNLYVDHTLTLENETSQNKILMSTKPLEECSNNTSHM